MPPNGLHVIWSQVASHRHLLELQAFSLHLRSPRFSSFCLLHGVVSINKGDSDRLHLNALRVAFSADQPSNIKIQRTGLRMPDVRKGFSSAADLERSINREGNHPNRACINDLNPLGAVHSYSLQHLLHTYS